MTEPKKLNINGEKEYYCYGPTISGDVTDYYCNQRANFSYNDPNPRSLLSKEETEDFMNYNTCNITAVIMALKLLKISMPQKPNKNSRGDLLKKETERLAQYMYTYKNKKECDPTIRKYLIEGTNYWLGRELLTEGSTSDFKDAIKSVVDGYPVVTSGYFFNVVIEDRKGIKAGYYGEAGPAEGYYSKNEDVEGIKGHYVCLTAVAYEEELSKNPNQTPVYYQIQDPYGRCFTSPDQQYPYDPKKMEKNDEKDKNDTSKVGKDIWITKEQFEMVFNKRKNDHTCSIIMVSEYGDPLSDPKYAEFSCITVLPDLLMNYRNSGWFSRDSILSYMYSSGYDKINGKYQGLVELFDEGLEGFSEERSASDFLDNLSDNKKIDNKKINDFFTNKSNYRYVASKNSMDYIFVNYISKHPTNNATRFFSNFLHNNHKIIFLIDKNFPDLKNENTNEFIDIKKIFAFLCFFSKNENIQRNDWIKEEDIKKLSLEVGKSKYPSKETVDLICEKFKFCNTEKTWAHIFLGIIENGEVIDKEKEYWPESNEEKQEIQDIISKAKNEKESLEYIRYLEPSIYYIDTNSNISDFRFKNRTKFSEITEISQTIEPKDFLDKKNYIFTGVRLYFSEGTKKYTKDSVKSKIDDNNRIKEMAFYFRYIDKERPENPNNGKLYRYIVNIDKHKATLTEEPKYFIPFLYDFKDLDESKEKESFYYEYNNNTFMKYIQFGNFKKDPLDFFETNDIEEFNDTSASTETKLKKINFNVGAGTKENIKLVSPTIDGFSKLDKESSYITAEDMEDVVIGCFSKDEPNMLSGDSIWAFSYTNNDSNNIVLKSQANDANQNDNYRYTLDLIYKENGETRRVDFGSIKPEQLVDLYPGKILKMNRFNYYNGYGRATRELIDLPAERANYSNYNSVSQPYSAGEKLFVAELQYRDQEQPTEEEESNNEWNPVSVNCMVKNGDVIGLGEDGREIISTNQVRGVKGAPLKFEKITDNMLKLSKELLSEKLSSDSKEDKECSLYIDNRGYLVHGYGFSYHLASIAESEKIKEQFEKCAEEYKNVFFKVGKEYAIVEKPIEEYFGKSRLNDELNKIKQNTKKLKGKVIEKEEIIEGMRVTVFDKFVLENYSIDKEEADKLLRKYISDISFGKVINCLKKWQLVLDGKVPKDENSRLAFGRNISVFENKATFGRLSQEAYECLVAISFYKDDFEKVENGIIRQLKDLVENNPTEPKEEIVEKAFKNFMNSATERFKTSRKVSDLLRTTLLETKDEKTENKFKIEKEQNSVDTSDSKLEQKKLTMELICTAVTGGFLNSVMGGGFNLLSLKGAK